MYIIQDKKNLSFRHLVIDLNYMVTKDRWPTGKL